MRTLRHADFYRFAFSLLTIAGPGLAAGTHSFNDSPSPPKLELEMTSREYEALLTNMAPVADNDPLRMILLTGKRNLDWIDLINQDRSPDKKLELSTPETQRGIPIDSPSKSNRTIVSAAWDNEIKTLPDFMTRVLINGDDFTRTIPGTDKEFLMHARMIDRIYQNASRWLLQEPYLSYYGSKSFTDVRGYYALAHEKDLESKLNSWTKLSDSDRERLKANMILLCINGRNSQCERKFTNIVKSEGTPLTYYKDYFPQAQAMWNSYFAISFSRSDVSWMGANPNEFHIPFTDPGRTDVKKWLSDNIQDEWKWNGWQLLLDFTDRSDQQTTHVEFEPGATPHVDGVGGSTITMDGNRNLQEYSSRWTIRHEYGHVLGFPDCYTEFYDSNLGVMINYQLDITNLMCSRTGHLQQKHVDELRRVYYKK